MGLIRDWWKDIQTPKAPASEARDILPYNLQSWVGDSGIFGFNGNKYALSPPQQTMLGSKETIGSDFVGLVTGAYMSNPIVYACQMMRLRLFTEARFQFRRLSRDNGRPGDLFGNPDLAILDAPWPGGTTGDLLARMLQDSDFAGNAFIHRRGDRLVRLRPDWVSIVYGSKADAAASIWNLDSEVLAYLYTPGGARSGNKSITLMPETVAHYAPSPDPLSPYRGMPWLTPIIREVIADSGATMHKQQFFENGATVNLAVFLDPGISKQMFETFKSDFNAEHQGALNAYQTLFVAGGTDVREIGSNFRQMDFKTVQGAGETRIAAAAGVPAVLVGLSEGLAAATYSNFGQARRHFADSWARPSWRNASGSLQRIVVTPGNAQLWYDDRDIAFLREDMTDLATIQQTKASTIKQLLESGFEADAVIKSVIADDESLLIGKHTGLFSVQLQAPGSTKMPQGEAPGEVPVGGGTGPEKPAINPAGNGKALAPAQKGPPNTVQASFADLVDILRARQPDIIHLGQPEITVNTPDVHVDVQAAPTPNVDVHTPDVRLEPVINTPDVHVDVQAAPTPNVEVHTPEVRVDVAAPDPVPVSVTTAPVTVNVPEQPAPIVNVNTPKTKRKVTRDKNGRIDGVEDE